MSDHKLLYFLAGLALGLSLALGPAVVKRLAAWLNGPDRVMVYRSIDGHDLHLHVFEAKGPRPAAGHPALLLFHGGAWQYGSPDAFFPQCRHFAQHGLTCVSAEYRIAARHGTDPRAAVQDARAALAYLRAQADDLDIDPSRIAAGGGSSGGHLAAALGVPLPLAEETGGDAAARGRPAALVLYNPMLDLSPCTPDHHLVAAFWQAVSPLQQVDAALPPSLILLGTEDREVPVATAQAFCEAASAQGGHCELALYEGARHGFFNLRGDDRQYFDVTNARVLAFLGALGWLRD
ncbi:alpha/beta hydrolase [Denitromonas iodatirespirans]|uniref:Alpha/beta hydrolase n=1 Tax=Denitromonas iodatirespirans TaxID=2795389 RepID=A0A944D877_DENI1|nr:alpha/beta hydrolase [Denitromonas iodatirespirans]MBT0960387.1 alpha/beta hydrolase [Denitromonas iodatirespirans]